MFRTLSAAAALSILLAAPLAAQRTSPTHVDAPATLAADSVRMHAASADPQQSLSSLIQAGAAFRVRTTITDSLVPLPAPPRGATTRNSALMIVGGAAIVVGALIGDDGGRALMIGGAAVGLLGLWGYLN